MSRRFVLIGDSQAVGLHDPLRSLAPSVGYELAGASVETGWTTARMVQDGRVPALISSVRPELALLVLGGNDTAGGVLAAAIAALRVQLSDVERVVWIGPLQSTDRATTQRHARAALAQAELSAVFRYVWIDGAQLSYDLPHAADGVHLTRAGYEGLAKRTAPLLRLTSPRSVVSALTGLFVGVGAVLSVAGWATATGRPRRA